MLHKFTDRYEVESKSSHVTRSINVASLILLLIIRVLSRRVTYARPLHAESHCVVNNVDEY